MSYLDDHNKPKEIPGNDGNRSGEASNAGSESKKESKRRDTKTVRILRLFFENTGWFDFQSIRRHGDSCLHSTVSTLRHAYGIEIDDDKHIVFGFNGVPTRCKKYRLRRTPENLRRVRAFLGLSDDEGTST